MKYYKDANNEVYAFEDDGSQDAFIPENLVKITEKQANSLRNPPETNEQIIARLEKAVDSYLDGEAKSLHYESIKTIVSYRDDHNPKFKAEGVAGYKLRSAVYTSSIQLIEDVTKGLKEVPTESELISSLPKITDFLQYE